MADWYIEASKLEDNSGMLAWVIDTCLKIAHPFAPFLTETIWQTLSWHNDLLITTSWPEKVEFDSIASAEFSRLKQLIGEIRFVLSELPGDTKYTLLYQTDSLIADNAKLIQRLAKLKDVIQVDQPRGLRLPNSGREAWIDLSAEKLYEHQTNLENRLLDVKKQIQNLQARLSNESYTNKAPAELVQESRDLLEQRLSLHERLVRELEVIK